MFCYYNPNPEGRAVGDCTVRALSKALGIPWEDAYLLLVVEGYIQCDLPSANSVWGETLHKTGFTRRMPTGVITVGEFAREHPSGIYVLALSGHVVCVEDGDLFDTWDSSRETVIYFWEGT